jgi:hypothetical protein
MTRELVDIELDRLIDGQARSQYRQGWPKMFTVDAKAWAEPLVVVEAAHEGCQ